MLSSNRNAVKLGNGTKKDIRKKKLLYLEIKSNFLINIQIKNEL